MGGCCFQLSRWVSSLWLILRITSCTSVRSLNFEHLTNLNLNRQHSFTILLQDSAISELWVLCISFYPSYISFLSSTMASADVSTAIVIRTVQCVRETFHGKTINLLSIYLHHLHMLYSFSLSEFVLFGKLVLQNVRVPPTGNLPPASFKFHLTMDTLAWS